MTADTGNERALADIEKYGCHILHVLEDESAPASHTQLELRKTSAHPELIVTGLKRDIAQWIVNEYNHRVRRGETFEPDRLYSGFLDGFDVMFRPVLKHHYEEYFGWGRWLYGSDDFRVFQLTFPNTSGKWPWDPEAPDEFVYFIPQLCEPFARA